MKPKTIRITPEINKALDKEDIMPTKTLETVKDTDEAAITITPPVDNNALKYLRNYSVWHKKCLKAVASDVVLNGQKINPVETGKEEIEDSDHKKLLDDIFNDYDNSQALFKVIRDFRTYTHAVFEILTNLEGELRGFKHIRAINIRMCKGGEKALEEVGSKKVYFKVYGNTSKEHEGMQLDMKTGEWSNNVPEENIASTVVWLTDGCEDSDYYHEPEYWEAYQVIMSDRELDSYNYDGLATNGLPNYLIMVAGDFTEEVDEDGLSFDEELEDTFKDVPNKPGTAIVLPLKTSGKDAGLVIEATKLSEPIKEGSYLKLSEANMNKILAAHEVPPSRLGVVYNGALGGSVDEERNKLYDNKVVNPLQLMLDNILNTLIADEGLLNITDFKHEFTRLDTKNVKSELDIATELVNHGAMTPGQLLQVFGDHFNLKVNVKELITLFPELDQYYYNGQPLGYTPDYGIMKSLNPNEIPAKVATILDKAADRIEGIKE
jgi:capsid portal protein